MAIEKFRNITFAGVSRDLDVIKVRVNGTAREIIIPALPRSAYWGVLTFMFENHSRRVYEEEFIAGVDEIMEEAAGDRWERFKNKDSVKTQKNGVVVEQEPRPWDVRLIINSKNLARVGKGIAYGKRLVERGFVLRHGTEPDGRSYFIMHMQVTPDTIKEMPRGRKAQPKVNKPAAPPKTKRELALVA